MTAMTAERIIREIREIEIYARNSGSTAPGRSGADFALTTVANSLAQLAARLSGMAADTWQPMETAPKGQRVELWIPPNSYRAGFSTHGEWSDDRYNKKPRPFWKYDAAVNLSHARSAQPTRWRPESEPPHV